MLHYERYFTRKLHNILYKSLITRKPGHPGFVAFAYMDKIHVDNIIRSRRRTVALVVTQDAKLIVRAPMDTPIGYIEDLVDQKRTWITRTIGEMKKRPAPPKKNVCNRRGVLIPR